jgi:hypothetical protein
MPRGSSIKPGDYQTIRNLLAPFPGKKPWTHIAGILTTQGIRDDKGGIINGKKLLESWLNYIDPGLNNSSYSMLDMDRLRDLYRLAVEQDRVSAKSGKYLLPIINGIPVKWNQVLPGRSPNVVKNFYNSSVIQVKSPPSDDDDDSVDDSDLYLLLEEGLKNEINPEDIKSVSESCPGSNIVNEYDAFPFTPGPGAFSPPAFSSAFSGEFSQGEFSQGAFPYTFSPDFSGDSPAFSPGPGAFSPVAFSGRNSAPPGLADDDAASSESLSPRSITDEGGRRKYRKSSKKSKRKSSKKTKKKSSRKARKLTRR